MVGFHGSFYINLMQGIYMNIIFLQSLDAFLSGTKGGFFQKVWFIFQISKKNIPKNYPEHEFLIFRQYQ